MMTSCFHVCSEGSNNPGHKLFKNKRYGREDDLTAAQNQGEMNAMLSQAFNRLTFKERQEQQDLLHGVEDKVPEDSASVKNSLQDLDDHLIRIKSGSVYEQAEKMDPMHVGSRAFRIMFLRGNRYDAEAAADQMIRFFKVKQQIFGTEKLVKNITIDDLDKGDRATLRSGTFQVPCKDRSNRQILFNVHGLRTYKNLMNELRVRYFITMKLLETEEVQRRGAIHVSYLVGQYKDSKNGEGFLDSHNLSMALPLHTAAFHACTDEWAQAALGNVALRTMPAKQRARFRLHFGTHLECLYMLSTYGIPGSLLPFVPGTSTIDLEPHLRWCQQCFANDGIDQRMAEPSSSGPITEPNPNDVLSVGSKKIKNKGNDCLRELVKNFAEAYKSGSNEDKRRIVDRIIDDIHGAGGRFLQQDKGSLVWFELSLSKVRLKMTQRFRNHNRRREPASQQGRGGLLIADRPLPNDVLFGRAQTSKANVLLHHLIKDRSEEYEALNRGMKVVVVDAIIERIRGEGGRFLEPTTGFDGYVELSTDSIRDRISTYFRNHRRSRKTKNS